MSAVDAFAEAQRRLEQLELLVDERKVRSNAKPWDGSLLDLVQKYVELTIDNGSHHETVRFRAWGNLSDKLNERKTFLKPAFYFVDLGSGWNALNIARVQVYYAKDDNGEEIIDQRTYRFNLNQELVRDSRLHGRVNERMHNVIARKLGVHVDSPMGLASSDEAMAAVLRYTRSGAYAAHLCFLALTGTDLEQDAYTDVLGVHRQPSSKYTIQPVTRCVRCARKLTAPASIDAAFGPDCQRIVFGSTEAYNTRVLGGKRR